MAKKPLSHRDMVVTINPSLNELEVVAFLQAKWEALQDKSKYDPPQVVQKESEAVDDTIQVIEKPKKVLEKVEVI